MTRITVDPELLSKLLNLTQPLELCDASGKILAQLVPAPTGRPWVPDFTEEELREAENSDKWYTTAEVLARLRA